MNLTEDQLFDIAQIVDNEYRGKRNTFTARKITNGYSLTTNVCDWASLIRIYPEGESLRIERIGPDTESWQSIYPETMNRVLKYLNSK